jgi:gas vesicle protein
MFGSTPPTESEAVMSDIRGTTKGIMVAAMVGAAVGAGVALLWAPRSRGSVAHRTREIKDRMASVIDQGTETIRRGTTETGRDGERYGHSAYRAGAPTSGL